jgi:hypothetical protein
MSIEPFSVAAFTRLKASQVDVIRHMAALNGLRFSAQVRELIELGMAIANLPKESNP